MRNNYKNSILSVHTTQYDELLGPEDIERQISSELDPSKSKGFLTSFKETQAYLEYCDNVIRSNQADVREGNTQGEFQRTD